MKVLIVFYSMYGHVLRMTEAVAEGARSVQRIDVEVRRVPETVPEEILKKSGAWEAHEECFVYEECLLSDLEEADAIIFGTPTRYGMMAAQMRQFLDKTGKLFVKQALAGKIGGVFTSSNTQHGGQESTILSFHTTLLHHGMIIAGLPYLFEGLNRFDQVTGGSPYGASTIVGPDKTHMPTENELAGARFQGEYIARLTGALAGERSRIIEGLRK